MSPFGRQIAVQVNLDGHALNLEQGVGVNMSWIAGGYLAVWPTGCRPGQMLDTYAVVNKQPTPDIISPVATFCPAAIAPM
ncbi:MAG: hypothetical protein R3C44_20620 [Chloroflexota bacterium]